MDAAPAVEVRLVPDRASQRVLSTLLGCVAASLAGWALALAEAPSIAQAVGAALAAVAAGAAAWRRGTVDGAALRWDGQAWHWTPGGDAPEVAGALAAAIDLDGWLLLRFDALDGRRRWMALSRARHSARWHALRCAVHARGTDPRALARLPV
jgi:hypothetical protein